MSELETIKSSLSMRDVLAELNARSVDISYDSLSDLVKAGDISEQLSVTGTGARKEFAPVVVDIIAEFWPQYRQAKGRLPQAPDMLRSFLSTRRTRTTGTELVPITSNGNALAPLPQADAPTPVQIAEAEGRARGLAEGDSVMNAHDAAEFLGVGVRKLRKYVPASFRLGNSPSDDRWYKSALLSIGR